MDLSKICLFKNIIEADYHSMMDCFGAKERHFNKGDILLSASLMSDSIAILTQGSAHVIREDIKGDRVILECLEPNSVFGRVMFFDTSNDNIYVLCEKDCDCIFIEYGQLTKRCEKACYYHTQVVENLFELMMNKAVLLSQRVEILSRRTIRNKLLCYFSILAANTGNNKVEIPFSMTALADYVCVDRSAMMRELNNMKADGLINLNKKRVEICSKK